MAVCDGLIAHARQDPGRCALVGAERSRTYGELAATVADIATALRERLRATALLAPTPVVGLLLRSEMDLMEAFHGAVMAGCAAMVLDADWSPAELRSVLAATPPDLLLVDPAAEAVVAGVLPGTLRSRVLASRDLVTEAPRAGAPDPVASGTAALPTVAAADPFYIGFTAGTTGLPKGFVRSHASWEASFAASSASFGIGSGDVVVAAGPPQHSLFCYASVSSLWAGAEVHVRRRFVAEDVLATIARHRATRVFAVPTMLLALQRVAERSGTPRAALASVRSVIVSGAPWALPDQRVVAELFPDAEAVEFFGASELSYVSLRSGREPAPDGTVGRALPEVEVSIRDDRGEEVPTGQVGRLHVRSPMVFSGYLEAGPDGPVAGGPDAEGWVTVGDLGCRDGAGFLTVVGRDGNVVISGGINIHPEEVEAVLRDLPAVDAVAAVGLPDPYWGEVLCAVLVWRNGACMDRADVRAHCRGRLAPAKRPRRFLVADDLPRTASGKVARAGLRASLIAGTFPAEAL